MNEPKTTVKIEDFTGSFGVDPVDSRLNILCPIISPAGPTELTRVTGPSMLKRLYFAGRSITTSDDYSAVFARAISANAPIYIKRGVRGTLKGGKSSAIGDKIYVDSSLNPISGLRAKFSQGSSAVSYDTALASLTGVITDSGVYSGEIGSSQIIVKGSMISGIPVKKAITLTGAGQTDIVVTIGSRIYTIPAASNNLNELASSLANDGFCPQAVLDSDGHAIRAQYRNGVWSQAADSKIATIQWLTDISVVPSDTYSNFSVTVPSVTLSMAKIKTEAEYNDSYPVSDAVINVSTGDTTYSFYTDAATSTGSVKVHLGDNLSFYGLMQAFTRQVSELFTGDSSVGSVVIIPNATNISVSDTGSILSVSSSNINTVQFNDKFAVISAFPCDTDAISIEIDKDEVVSGVYNVSANYASGEISESWAISFDSGMIDGYGDSLYYQRVNEESQLIRIVELYGDNVTNQSFNIGSEVSSAYCGVDEIISAYESMVETEESDVMFDYITDGGLVNTSLSLYIKQMCEKYHSFYPASVATDQTLTEASLKARRSSIGDYFAMNCIGATQRAALLDSGSAIFPASYFYLSRRIALGNTSSEFAQIYAQANGNIEMQNPLQKFTESVRENLLTAQVPTLKRESTGLYCVNLNLTCFKQKSYLQEDGTALMINKINQIADIYAKSILSMPNTDRTRSTIQVVLSDSINGRLRVGTDYGPQSVRVQCDSSNNPQSLIDQYKVRIDIYATFASSIREVLIYTNVLPLQQ